MRTLDACDVDLLLFRQTGQHRIPQLVGDRGVLVVGGADPATELGDVHLGRGQRVGHRGEAGGADRGIDRAVRGGRGGACAGHLVDGRHDRVQAAARPSRNARRAWTDS